MLTESPSVDDLLHAYFALGEHTEILIRTLRNTVMFEVRIKLIHSLRVLDQRRLRLLDKLAEALQATAPEG